MQPPGTIGSLVRISSAHSADRFRTVVTEEMDRVRAEIGDERFTRGKFTEARELFERLSLAPRFEEFLTVPAYELVTSPRHTPETRT